MKTKTQTIQQLLDRVDDSPFSILRGYLQHGQYYWDRSAGCYCNEKWIAENDKNTNWQWALKLGDEIVHIIGRHTLLANDEITFPAVM